MTANATANMENISLALKNYNTIVYYIKNHAVSYSDRKALVFLDRGETPSDEATFASLDDDASRIANSLISLELRGKTALLAIPPGLDFTRVFLGCLYAGTIPVPVPYVIKGKGMNRITAIAQDAKAAVVITSQAGAEDKCLIESTCNANGFPMLITSTDLIESMPSRINWEPSPDDIAFIQYTSGATNNPKGVVITHRNILANQFMIKESFAHSDSCVGVNWLPHHHDMGLIGCILQPLFLGGRSILMSPLAFLQKPAKWLNAISKYQATTAGAPNFAYDLCVRQIQDNHLNGIDLSSWQVAFCGSEPVRISTLNAFAERFSNNGFSYNALYPCYGLAEATLLVTGVKAGGGIHYRKFPRFKEHSVMGDLTKRTVISCGKPAAGTKLAIIDQNNGERVKPGHIGEICVSGHHVSPGFWCSSTNEALVNLDRLLHLDGDTYLRSGDLGIIEDGELYVVGRIKDMIIIRGQNIYAEDIEDSIISVTSGINLIAMASFGIDLENEEALVVVIELDRASFLNENIHHLKDLICKEISHEHGVLPREVVFCPPSAIPRSSSGKIQRGKTKGLYLEGKLTRWNLPAESC